MRQSIDVIKDVLDNYNRMMDFGGTPERIIYNTRHLAESIWKELNKNGE